MTALISKISVTHKGEELENKRNKSLTTVSQEPYKCKYCSEKITLEQIKEVVSELTLV